ncbi:ABC transporter permease [Pseudactinotalea terrae]|jgi:lipooligosaccharide transport system permease protein|uniref:ABC transporter permease n=1 Tax=Pseudactinotalea terrae TaxID=1743262 RepID=UPI0012E2C144|nr:ABC transporter permease [Pseudactinotalea terrae]
MTATTPAGVSTAVESPPGGGWLSVLAYWMAVYKRVWKGTIISSFLAPLAYLAGMGIGLGSLIDSGERTAVEGVPYLAFVATGLLAAQAMQTGVGEATFPVMGAIKWHHTYEAMLATPLRVQDLVRGHVVYAAIRVATTVGVFAIVSIALGALSGWGVLGAVVFAILGGLAFAMPVYFYSCRVRSEQGYNVLSRFVIMPLFLFSGTFFPISQLPAWLEALAWVSPLTHAGALTRAAALGPGSPFVLDLGGYLLHIAYLLLWAVGGYLLGVRALRSRMGA